MTVNANVHRFLHSGGTKFYEIWEVEDTSSGLHQFKIISRWGKVGLSGFFKEVNAISAAILESVVSKEIARRKSRDYNLIETQIYTGDSLADIMPADVYRRYKKHVAESLGEVISDDEVIEVIKTEPLKPKEYSTHKNWGDW